MVPPKNERALPIEDLRKVMDRFSDLAPKWVVLTGGEPLMVKGIGEVLERIDGIGAKIALSTNTSFFRRNQEAIERYVSSLNIPLDGSTPQIHAASRNDESSYHTFFDVLEHYAENPDTKPGLLRVGTVFSKPVKGDLVQIARRLEPFAEAIDRWKIYELMGYEFQGDLRDQITHQPEDFERETSELLEFLGDSSLAGKVMISPAGERDKAYFMVNPRGIVVMPTEVKGISYEIPIGNILTDTLPEIIDRWRGQVDPSHYHGNHSHYEKSGTEVQLRVLGRG